MNSKDTGVTERQILRDVLNKSSEDGVEKESECRAS